MASWDAGGDFKGAKTGNTKQETVTKRVYPDNLKKGEVSKTIKLCIPRSEDSKILLISLRVPSPDSFPPDSEQNVIDQTEDVFKNYLYQSWRQDRDKQEYDGTPSLPQLTNFTADPLSPAAQVGRRLAKIGDDINQKYQNEFDSMINNLQIDQSTAYEAYAGVARKLLEGGINWGRILTLFSFGYRIATRVLGLQGIRDLANALGSVITNVVRFITDTSQGIVRWIASQGGWRSAMQYVPSVSWPVIAGIVASGAAAVCTVFYLRMK